MSFEYERYRFGSQSRRAIASCHPLLQRVLEAGLKHSTMDFMVTQGHRGKVEQNRLLREGKTTLAFPRSQHNHLSDERDVREGWAPEVGLPLSMAADVAPWGTSPQGGIDWSDVEEFRWLNGFLVGIGNPIVRRHGFYIRSGADWDSDGDHDDQRFIDLPHLELRRL